MTSIQITYLYPSSVMDVALVHQLVPYLYWELHFHHISGLSFGQGCLLNGQYHFHSGFPPPLWYGLCFVVSWYIMFQVSFCFSLAMLVPESSSPTSFWNTPSPSFHLQNMNTSFGFVCCLPLQNSRIWVTCVPLSFLGSFSPAPSGRYLSLI